ncbi:hypothetical protein [Halopiger thermotolerans]
MPFIAHREDRTVLPEEVDDGEDVVCPTCSERMQVRGPFEDGTARHFFHPPGSNAGGCDGVSAGESETHRKLKSLAVSALRQKYEGQYARCAPEIGVDVNDTETAADQRRADAYLEFTEENRFFGQGIIVEVQYRNEGKNVRATTHDYLSQDFSVYWATPDDFQNDRFLIDQLEVAFNTGSEEAYSPYQDEPPSLTGRDQTDRNDDEEERPQFTREDPIPDCSHVFVDIKKRRRCIRCDLCAENRVYDPQRQQFYRPKPHSEAEEDAELVYNLETVEKPVSPRRIEEKGEKPTVHSHDWRVNYNGREWCTCFWSQCEATITLEPDRVVIDHAVDATPDDGRPKCDHVWEELGFTTVCTECGKER